VDLRLLPGSKFIDVLPARESSGTLKFASSHEIQDLKKAIEAICELNHYLLRPQRAASNPRRKLIEMRPRQLSFGDVLIAEEVSDLGEYWMNLPLRHPQNLTSLLCREFLALPEVQYIAKLLHPAVL
jgi:hypothetical protein